MKNKILLAVGLGILSLFVFFVPQGALAQNCSLDTVKFLHQEALAGRPGIGWSTSTNNEWVINNQTDCSVPVTIVVFKVFSPSSNQELFYSQQITIQPYSHQAYGFPTPVSSGHQCYQFDLVYGHYSVPIGTSLSNWENAVNWDLNGLGGKAVNGLCPASTPPPLQISCSSSPNPANIGQQVTFASSVSGGTGTYSYTWTGSCTGSNKNCFNSFGISGNKTATLKVVSGTQSQTTSCSVSINQPTPPLQVSCSASPNPADIGQQVTFAPSVSGGTGTYNYSWTGACTGFNKNCSKSFSNSGNQTAFLQVTSDSQTKTTSCSVSILTKVPECSDGIDNDGDGSTDFLGGDFSCSFNGDDSESNPKAQCQDGIDNDVDGKTDFPNDPHCQNKQDNYESTPLTCSEKVRMKINLNDVRNVGTGNVQPLIYLGDGTTRSSGEWIDLSVGGSAIVDSNMNTNVPGIAVKRGNPVQITLYGVHGTSDREIVSGTITIEGGSFSGIANVLDTPLEGWANSSASDSPGDDEALITSNSNRVVFEMSVSTHIDSFRLSYNSLPVCSTQCSDNIDNDNDGVKDFPDDFSCSSLSDNDETNPKAHCQDGIDNDNDGYIDYPQDQGCSSKQDNSEFNAYQCSDNVDNDNDGAKDYPDDFSCSSSTDSDEANPKAKCQDGIDNDNDNKVDYPQDPGCSNKQDNNEFNETITCSSNSDCGSNGYTDSPFCQNDDVYQNYRTYTCNNPGTSNSYCSSSVNSQVKQNCSSDQMCSNGSCTINTLNISCSASPNPANTNQTVNFSPSVSGGTGSYTYSWTGSCSGFNQNCSNSFSNSGSQTAFLQVTSGSQTKTTSCGVQVNQQCTPNSQKQCVGNSVYWYDSCGSQGSLFQTCNSSQTCSNGQCLAISCSSNSDCGSNGYIDSPFCQSDDVYQNFKTYTCNNPGTSNSFCSSSVNSQIKQNCSSDQMCSNGSCTTNTLNISCSSSPNPANTNQTVNFSPSVSGGTGSYTYSWTGSCSGFNQNCSNSFSNSGSQTAFLQVTSGGQTKTTSCGVQVNQSQSNNLVVSCSVSPSPVQVNQNTTFSSSVSGGSGNYNYSWTGSCTGSSQNCSNSFGSQGNYTANIYVTSGNQSANATCSVNVNQTNNQQQVNLDINKTVRNITRGGNSWSSSTAASPSELIEFRVMVQSLSSQTVNNVVVKDIFPNNLIFYDSVYVDGVFNSGSMISGINVGSLSPNQTKTITYRALVAQAQNFSFGTTSLVNSASASSSNPTYTTNMVSASVLVTRTGSLGVTNVPTGIANGNWPEYLALLLVIIAVIAWIFGSFRNKVPDWVGSSNRK